MEEIILNDIITENMLSLEASEKMLECLNIRLSLLNQNYANLSEYERNEIDITRLKTQAQINRMIEVVSEKKNDLRSNFELLMSELYFRDENIN